MQSTERNQQFLTLLAESGLLSAEDLSEVSRQHELAALVEPLETARRLVKAGVLTRYQAEQLLAGRARGLVIDHFRILELLGFGGMGRLYLAEETKSRELVAVKVLSEQHRHDTGMLLRLKLEAAAGKRLHHPSIVRTIECRDTGAVYYLAMEFVSGINLLELLALKGPLPWPQVCDFMRQAAIALQYVHDQNIIHRDVKADNLLVDKQGRVKLLDFGLALLPHQEDSEFSLSMIFGHNCIGTPDYIPPEQSIDAQKITPQADQYSLGCTMYYLLTGRLPFPRDRAVEKVEAHRHESPPPIRDRVADLPPEVADILERLMEKRPERRFASMQHVAQALGPFSRRTPLSFSVNGAIRKRVQLARERNLIEHPSRPRPQLSSKAATISEIAENSQRTAEAIDTPLGSETRPLGDALPRQLPEPDAAADAERLTLRLEEDQASTAILVSRAENLRLLLDKDRFVIGRDEACDLTIPAGDVSSRHCELRREGQWWTLTDLASTNGVKVNGLKVKQQQMLWHGDEITISFTHQFRILDPTQPDPLARPSRLKTALIGLGLLLAAGALAAVGWYFFAGDAGP
jgi:eukaryotic-like serine/threonine-protein kinase